VKVCDKTCIFFFFPIINKYFLMAKRSLLSKCPSYIPSNLRELGTQRCSVTSWKNGPFADCFCKAEMNTEERRRNQERIKITGGRTGNGKRKKMDKTKTRGKEEEEEEEKNNKATTTTTNNSRKRGGGKGIDVQRASLISNRRLCV